MATTCEMIPAKGHVKWFDENKGYGFLVSDDLSSDILIHAKVLRRSGYTPKVAEGAVVECMVEQNGPGFRASHVTSVDNTNMQLVRAKVVAEELRKIGANVTTGDLLQALTECGFRLDAVTRG